VLTEKADDELSNDSKPSSAASTSRNPETSRQSATPVDPILGPEISSLISFYDHPLPTFVPLPFIS
jgi:hypothetical protein